MESGALRRYDVDWLRVIALFLLILYHALLSFQDFGSIVGAPPSSERLTYLWPLAEMLNVWRIPILFVISGMGLSFAARRRNLRSLYADRTLRLGIPMIPGSLVIGPLTALPLILALSDRWTYMPSLAHLWFLSNILLYSVILAPVARHLAAAPDARIPRFVQALMRPLVSPLVLVVLFAFHALLVPSWTFSLYAGTLHGLVLGFVGFFFGVIAAASGPDVWNHFRRLSLPSLLLAFGLYLRRTVFYVFHELHRVEQMTVAIESALWIIAVLGIADRFLNRPSHALRYLSEAVFPVYIFHLVVQTNLSLLVFRIPVSGEIQYLILVAGTLAISFTLYEVVKRVRLLRPLFGLKFGKKEVTT